MKRLLVSFSCTLFFSAFALCQITSSTSFSPDGNGMHGSMTFGAPFSHGTAITGAPYSAEEVDEHVQTLADGTHISQTDQRRKFYRDSMGRTRSERHPFRGPLGTRANVAEGPTIVEIIDPVAHVKYTFDFDEPIAHRQELPTDDSRRTSVPAHVRPVQPAQLLPQLQPMIGGLAVGTAAGNSSLETASTAAKGPDVPPTATRHNVDGGTRPQTTTEDLGTQIIEGIPAKGTRNTTTWPVGSVGNDQPITTVSEHWISPDIKETILSKSDDPRYGEHTHKLVDISRSEPDASLFEPPPGYTVKDETGEFKINWSSTR